MLQVFVEMVYNNFHSFGIVMRYKSLCIFIFVLENVMHISLCKMKMKPSRVGNSEEQEGQERDLVYMKYVLYISINAIN